MRKTTLSCVAVVAAMQLTLCDIQAENILVNSDFETVVSTTPASQWPTDVGYWAGDGSAIVTLSNGVLPLDGNHMLQFIWTSSQGHASSYGACEVLQVVSLSAYKDAILQGLSSAVLSANFNRVAGDSETDSEVRVRVLAFSGATNTFLSQYENSSWLADSTSAIITDGVVGTWETATTSLLLPAATDFVAVQISATENVFNDVTGVEFDGHYADAVRLEVVPEPATLSLLILSSLAILKRYRKGA